MHAGIVSGYCRRFELFQKSSLMSNKSKTLKPSVHLSKIGHRE